jgi:hypothetical protein
MKNYPPMNQTDSSTRRSSLRKDDFHDDELTFYAVLKGQTVKDTIRIRPLCCEDDLIVAFNDLLNPNYFKRGYIQFTDTNILTYARGDAVYCRYYYVLNEPGYWKELMVMVRGKYRILFPFLCPHTCRDVSDLNLSLKSFVL